jgi:hypothetical protein
VLAEWPSWERRISAWQAGVLGDGGLPAWCKQGNIRLSPQ